MDLYLSFSCLVGLSLPLQHVWIEKVDNYKTSEEQLTEVVSYQENVVL